MTHKAYRLYKLRTRLALMAGTILIAFLPLYLSATRDAIYDGGYLIISFAFLSDALFRLVDPLSRKRRQELNLYFFLSILLLQMLALRQYGPIANDLRREKIALQQSIDGHSVEPLYALEIERKQNEKEPNSSAALLLAGVVAEFGVILYLES